LDTPLEYQIGPLLRGKGLKLVLAESCTGGLVGHRVTNVPGSSDYYLGSITAYAYEAKERLLGVQHDTLIAYGAVSRETALEMARGVRQALATDFGSEHVIGLSITGIAGPGGGTPTKPVGLVWFGLSTPDGDWAWSHNWPGDREQNKADSAEWALKIIYTYLEGHLENIS
jgi:PncC family amidohydrolase